MGVTIMIPSRQFNPELVAMLKQFPNTTLHDFIAAIITSVLERRGGNRTHTAKELKISLRTLRNQLHAIEGLGFTVVPPPNWGRPKTTVDEVPNKDM